jgi:hypothetical protein
MRAIQGLGAIAALFLAAITSNAQPAQKPLTDLQIAEIIVCESRQDYLRTRGCPCPDNRAKDGSSCGGRSAACRPGGAAPYCYMADVPEAAIQRYRSSHSSTESLGVYAACGPQPVSGVCARIP